MLREWRCSNHPQRSSRWDSRSDRPVCAHEIVCHVVIAIVRFAKGRRPDRLCGIRCPCQRRLFESRRSQQVGPLIQGERRPASQESRASSQEVRRPKAAPQMTVTLMHLAAALSHSHDVPKKQTEAVLGDFDDADHEASEEGRHKSG